MSRPGHDGDWCRDCQDGCGEAYGGACPCCVFDELEDEEARDGYPG